METNEEQDIFKSPQVNFRPQDSVNIWRGQIWIIQRKIQGQE